MRTTPEGRAALRRYYNNAHDEDLTAAFDDLDEALAELAALRRVEAENPHMEREQHVLHDEHRWCIGDASNGVVGWGLTMVEALAMYDEATKEQR